eukprot:scaffold7214_cov410-Prasinococcus_capsulatus_cf.AAC.8
MDSVVVVGGGKVGCALYTQSGGQAQLVRRGEPIPRTSKPILVATKNSDLDCVVRSTPRELRGQLVFLQNGALGPWLNANGLSGNTQMLAYFGASEDGSIQDTGASVVCGPYAQAVREFLESDCGVRCTEVAWAQYSVKSLHKLMWSVVCSALSGTFHSRRLVPAPLQSCPSLLSQFLRRHLGLLATLQGGRLHMWPPYRDAPC